MAPRFQVRPVGGGTGCLVMLLVSVVASVVLTVVLDVVLRSLWPVRVSAGRS